jgi:hypothetical protein
MDDVAIVSAGERLANSAAAYKELIDERLGEDSGLFVNRKNWLLRETEASSETVSPALQSQDSGSFILFGKYFLRIEIPEDFMVFARRYLDRNVATLEEALRLFCEKDGWNPKVYPDGLVNVTERNISCYVS